MADTAFKAAAPKDGRYLVPLRATIRKGDGIELRTRVSATFG